MALNAAIVWEVSADPGSDDANGGGFKAGATGTDYTYPNKPTPRVIFDNVTITGTVNATTTRLDIVGYAVAATDVGNVCQLSVAEGALAFFEITAQGNNYWTLDRAIGTAGQAVTGRMGGALASPGALNSAISVGGQKAYIKSGTYTITTSTLGKSGPVSLPALVCFVEGYNSIRGDLGTAPIISTGAQTNVVLFTSTGSPYNHLITNIGLDGNHGSGNNGFYLNSASREHLTNCYAQNFDGATTTYGFNFNANSSTATNCLAQSCGVGFIGSTSLYGCVVIGCSGIGISDTNGTLINCIVHGCVGDGIYISSVGFRISNCISDGNGGDGFKLSALVGMRLINCLATNNAGVGFSSTGSLPTLLNCASYSNTSGRTTAGTPPLQDYGAITLTTDPFINGATHDFRLNNTSGGGAACIGAGIGVYGQTGPAHIGAVAPVIDFPDADQVLDTISFGYNSDSTGTLDLPGIQDVRKNVVYGSGTKTGDLTIPAEADVRENVSFGYGYSYGYEYGLDVNDYEYFGLLDLPLASNVKSGIQFDNETKTGTLTNGILIIGT